MDAGVANTYGRAALRVTERANAASALSADPKFRKYTQQVDKCLSTFESVHEWADFISFLTKLLKTLQSFTQFKEIPRKLLVGKRLAQCLNPALPTGVHQRALDVYSHVLSVLGPDGLQRDLQIWSSGLFPFFAYSATSVRPTLLNIYDKYYLPLQAALRPVMKAFILALLPGLEEENGEFFEKVLTILDQLSSTVSQAFFLQNIWLVLLTSPTSRGSAINYLSRRFPKLAEQADITPIIGRDVGLMIRAFATALEDDDILVRRGVLELLVQSFRLDSKAFTLAQPEDQELLMRAASGVVLRRDLSLNRRLYTWLLGPAEDSEAQVEYLKKHSLNLLQRTLLNEMLLDQSDVPDTRPYKIFISLLDKWELGTPLTKVLIVDSMKAVKQRARQSGAEAGVDLLMSVNTLYEAIDPIALWRPLFAGIFDALTSHSADNEAIQMSRFVLNSFRAHDEEVARFHLPLIFMSLAELLRMTLADGSANFESSIAVPQCLLLMQDIFTHISSSSLARAIEGTIEGAGEMPAHSGPLVRAMAVYGLERKVPMDVLDRHSAGVPFVEAFKDLSSISSTCAERLASPQDTSKTTADCLEVVTSLCKGMVKRIEERAKDVIAVSWDPKSWLRSMMLTLNQDLKFSIVDEVISSAVAFSQAKHMAPRPAIDNRAVLSKMVTILLHYLRPQYVPYHFRAVQLIWALEFGTCHHHLESILANSLTEFEHGQRLEAFEAFGVLWRLTDDSLLPGVRFKIPVMILLDSLRSDDVNLRRVGETWMRCCLKSYLRVVDPILYDLADPTIRRVAQTLEFNGRDVRGFLYERPFDLHRVHHLMITLLSVARFGGQGFTRMIRTTALRKAAQPGLLARAEAANLAHDSASYMDVLLEILIRIIQSEPSSSLVPTMTPDNTQLQGTALDLLQTLVSRGDADLLTLENAEAAIISKLYASIHTDHLDLQNKLLHVLHSIIVTSSEARMQRMRRASEPSQSEDSGSLDSRRNGVIAPKVNPLLVQTLVDGVSRNSKRPLLQHWIDFILMTVPQSHTSPSLLVFPLSDCICRQLRSGLEDLVHASNAINDDQLQSNTTDAEFVALLNALERLVLIGLTKSETEPSEDDGAPQEKANVEPAGLLGLVSNVFSPEAPTLQEEQLTTRSPNYRCLEEAVHILYSTWILTSAASINQSETAISESYTLIFSRVRTRCKKVLERLFRVQSGEVLECLIECSRRSDDIIDAVTKANATYEIVDILSASAQTVVHMLCESISHRVLTSPERSRRLAVNTKLSESDVYAFLEDYLARLEGPIALQVWTRYLALAKEICSNVHLYKRQIFPTLKCYTILAEKITQTTAIEDRRMRKELQDIFTKLADPCILIAGRAFESNNWIRRGTKDSLGASDRAVTPLARVASEVALNEKPDSPVVLVDDSPKLLPGPDLIDQVSPPDWKYCVLLQSDDPIPKINSFLATKLLPDLRRFLLDPDRVLTLCTNIVYYVVSPAIRSKAKTLELDSVILNILTEMVKNPAAIKAWRSSITDAFNDNRFFNSTPLTGSHWRPLVRSLMDSDKAGLVELIGRITSVPSANIFANKEYEMLLRSLNLRRLSYVLFSGEKNQYMVPLPAIQEKLVDLLRSGTTAPVVLSEVYLCLRVLLCRLSSHNMTGLWPVVITELFRVFEQSMASPPPDGSDELVVLLSACKFLDLVLVLQTEEFQVHQWMFLTDTVDAVYRPEAWIPESIMDQLAEIIGDLPDVRGHKLEGLQDVEAQMAYHASLMRSPGVPANGTLSAPRQHSRRPLLGSVRSVESIKDLVPFFSYVSLFSYESVYSSVSVSVLSGAGGSSNVSAGGTVDWDAVEKTLMDEMFDGR
ncbi:hypothetical protein FRB98_004046 [Tulasnella sp. 332]|nr:hypothetical protein FRB98_004046 [Tulasnella sp. 332]